MNGLWIPQSARKRVLRCHHCWQEFPIKGDEPTSREMRDFGFHTDRCYREHDEERYQEWDRNIEDNPFLTASDKEKAAWFEERG